MNILLPLSPADEDYNYISHMSKDEMLFALRNFIPKQVLGYPETYKGKCPNCKKEIKRTDRYCSRCGKALKHISC